MRKQILGVTQNDEKKAIKAFADQNKENALKTRPKVRVFFTFRVIRNCNWTHGEDEGLFGFVQRTLVSS